MLRHGPLPRDVLRILVLAQHVRQLELLLDVLLIDRGDNRFHDLQVRVERVRGLLVPAPQPDACTGEAFTEVSWSGIPAEHRSPHVDRSLCSRAGSKAARSPSTHGLALASTSRCAGTGRVHAPLAPVLRTARHHTHIGLHRSSYLTQKPPPPPRHETGSATLHTHHHRHSQQRNASFIVGGWRTLHGPA